MARKPKAPPKPVTREEKIAAAVEYFKRHTAWYINMNLVDYPNRKFEVGQQVYIGNLQNVILLAPLYDGKAWLVEYSKEERVNSVLTLIHENFHVWWAVDIHASTNPGPEQLFRPHLRGNHIASDLSSLFHMYTNDGLVCNPAYQRGYVWTDNDRQQLLASVFERLEIGSFTLVRNHGYDENPTEFIERVNLQGETVKIPKTRNNTVEIIDGQQRLTTLVHFWLDKFKYNGMYFSDLTNRDRGQFENFNVKYRLIESEDVSQKELLRMFLQANRGVPQSEEHLAKVRELYNNTAE